MKQQKRSAKKPAGQGKEAYDRVLSILLIVLALLIPLKFGVPNLDVGSPSVPVDLVGIGEHLRRFFAALFSSNPLSAMRVISDVISWPWPEEMAQILILLIVFLWGMKSFSQRSFLLRVGKVDAMMWLFVLSGFVATLISPGFHFSVVILKQFVSYALLYFVAVHALDSPELQRKVIKCLLISTAVVALLALYQFFLGLEETRPIVKRYVAPELQDDFMVRIGRRRVFSVFVYPNSLAGFLLVVLPLTLFYGAMHREWFRKKNVKKLIAYAIVLPLACLVSFVLTQSKAGFLTFLIVGVASFVAARKRLGVKPKVLVASLLAVLILLVGFVLSPPGRRLVVEKGRFTLRERLEYWKAGYGMVSRSPVVGNGFNSFGLLYPRYRVLGAGEARAAHNNFLQVLIETGLVGFLFFAGVWVFGLAAGVPFVRRYLRGEKADRFRETVVLSAFTGIVCFLIHSLADFDLYIPGIAMTVWLFLGLMVNNASSGRGRRIQLTDRGAVACTVALVIVCGFGVFYASKTLNAGSHLAVAQTLVESREGPPPGEEEYERAIADVRKALKWDPANHNLRVYLARTYFALGRYKAALSEYATADRLLHGLSPMIAHHRGRILLEKMKTERAVEWEKVLGEFRKAALRAPVNPFHRLVYSYYLSQAGRREESERQLKETRRLDRSGKQAIKSAVLLYRDDPFVDELETFFAGTQGSPPAE